MSDNPQMKKAELLSKIDEGWKAFNAYLATLTPEQLTEPKDMANWSGKDHVIHLAEWETSMLAMLNKEDRAKAMGIDPAIWSQAMTGGDFDPINAVLQQRNKDKTWAEVQTASQQAHQRLVGKIQSLSEDDLQRPYDYFQPGTNRDIKIVDWLSGNTYEHYDEHQSYIKAIVDNNTAMSKEELLSKIDKGWNDFNAYLITLTPQQVTVPKDAAGWRALDHVIHLADWEHGVLALLNKEDRLAAMGVDAATWATGDYDKINGVLQQNSKDKTLEQARQYVMDVHQRLVDKVRSMSDADLQLPYSHYAPSSKYEAPVIKWIQINTYDHYAEHIPWIAAIVAEDTQLSKAELLNRLQKSWNDVNTFLKSLSETQLLVLTDAGGWTVKDHVMHMAAWEDGLTALLDKKDRRVYMGIEKDIWKGGDDAINAVIQRRYKDLMWSEVQQRRQAIHEKLLQQIVGLDEKTLQGPYTEFNPDSPSKRPITEYVSGQAYEHYDTHLAWMEAIAASENH